MATLYLGFQSAIEYWRAVGAGLVPKPVPATITRVEDDMNMASDILRAAPRLAIANRQPIHVLVGNKARAYSAKGVVHHTCAHQLPAGSFCRISENVLVASPALCLLHAAQMTRQGKMLPLLELAYEFLGSYSLCDGTHRGFMKHDPFLDYGTLAKFKAQLPKHMRGRLLLDRTVNLAIPGSASPRETESALMLCLPESLGGYAFPSPVLNQKIELNEEMRNLTDKAYLCLDLHWPGTDAVFEYDGADHLEPDKILEDKSRRNLLATMGYQVIVIEKGHVADVRLFNQQMEQLARLLGISMRRLDNDEAEQRTRLRSYLFDPRHLYRSPLTKPIEKLPEAPEGGARSENP